MAQEQEQRIRAELLKMIDPIELRDRICQDKCNEDLLLGLEMVKMHIAFGSISVPPVIDENDLKLFCRLDGQHSLSNSLLHTNNLKQITAMLLPAMIFLLPCYRHVIPILKRECGAKKCGPYINIDNTVIGRANRCRLLICDIKCAKHVLIRHCANKYGQQAAHFIMNYTSQQVSFWMKNLTKLNHTIGNPTVKIPSSCSRLICQKFQCVSWKIFSFN